MTEHETPENPPQPGPETPNEQPETPAASTGPAGPAGPADPALAPGPLPEQTPDGFGPNKKLSTGALIGIIAGGIIAVLVLAAVIIIPLANRGGGGESGVGTGPGPTPLANPEEFVEGYLQAIADGDADAALEYVGSTGYSDDLLTDEVLARSLELGAIDDIDVGKASESESGVFVVPAAFTIGGEEVSREFEVRQSEYDGALSVQDGLITVSVSGFEELGLTANGVEITEYPSAFPGTYEFAVGLDGFAVGGAAVHRLVTDEDADALYELKPTLDEARLGAFRDLVSTSLRECMAMTSLATPCGFDVTDLEQDGYVPVDGTIVRTISAEGEAALADLAPQISGRTVVTTSDHVAIEVTFTGQNAAGQRAQFEVIWGPGMMKTPKVDFAAETPTVVWE